jgi:hypothetical protein
VLDTLTSYLAELRSEVMVVANTPRNPDKSDIEFLLKESSDTSAELAKKPQNDAKPCIIICLLVGVC